MNELKNKLSLATKIKERNKKLYDKEYISEADYEKVIYEYNLSKSLLEQLTKTTKSKWELQLKDYEQTQRNIKVRIKTLMEQLGRYSILAPISGSVQELQTIQPNSYLLQNQFIAKISPNDSLIAEIYVAPKDIGYIKPNQKITLQVDTYNYREWGLLKGNVMDISNDIISNNNSYFFKVRCKPNKNYLLLNDNIEGELKKGMTLTANFLLSKRSLYNLLFDKIDNWINPQISSEN